MGRRRPAGNKGTVKSIGGFTLLELLVVMAIMAILFGIATLSWQSMRQRYNVEKQTKKIYTDMMQARLRAMQRNRDYFVVLSSAVSPTSFSVYEDGPPTSGNGQFNVADDLLISEYSLMPSYSMTLYTLTSVPSPTQIEFSSEGLADLTNTGLITITVSPTAGGEYDCISIDQVITGMGKWNGTQCVVK